MAPSRFSSPAAVLGLVAAAVVTRFLFAGKWSLWQDEETSIYFSQKLDHPFVQHFPLFFLLLRGVLELTGISVFAGRIIACSLGAFGIVLACRCVTKLASREAGVLTGAFLTVSLGHLFWSQSIRYYILLFAFQICAIYLFVDGFEKGNVRRLLGSCLFLLFGVLTHLSGALLFPVLAGHLLLSIVRREKTGGYGMKGYLAFGIPFAFVCIAFALQYTSFKASMAQLVTREQGTSSLGLLGRLVAYFGVPTVMLGCMAPFLARGILPARMLQFFMCLAFLPVLELLVIARLNLVIALWYQGFIGVFGFAALAATTLCALRQRGYLGAYRWLTGGALLTPLLLFFAYYSSMHGDRPRWKDAGEFLKRTAHIDAASSQNPVIYSTVVGVVAFYLGSEPSRTQNQELVRGFPPTPPDKDAGRDQWFVAEMIEVPPTYGRWLEENCTEEAVFEAWTGPRDRSVRVFRRK